MMAIFDNFSSLLYVEMKNHYLKCYEIVIKIAN